jgi:hypothetical protein
VPSQHYGKSSSPAEELSEYGMDNILLTRHDSGVFVKAGLGKGLKIAPRRAVTYLSIV